VHPLAVHLGTWLLPLFAAAVPQADRSRPDSATSARQAARAVDSLARLAIAEGLAPGLGIALTSHGRIVHLGTYGYADASARIPVTARTLWYVASTTKAFTGLALAQLMSDQRISLQSDVRTLIPGLETPVGADPRRLTLAAFLSHTTGLTDMAIVQSASFTAAIPAERWPSLLRSATVDTIPGLVYSNLGYEVAAMVIDARRPEGWRQFTTDRVFVPAGMHDTHLRISTIDPTRIARPTDARSDGTFRTARFDKRDETMAAAGGVLSTLGDLARFTIIQTDAGRIDGREVFRPSLIARTHAPLATHTRPQSKRFAHFEREAWGIGWDLGSYNGEPMVSRFGSYHSTRSHLSFLPRISAGAIAQSNGGAGTALCDLLAAYYYDLSLGLPAAHAIAAQRMDSLRRQWQVVLPRLATQDSVRASRQRPTAHPAATFAGQYTSALLGTLAISSGERGLHFRWGVLDGELEVFDAPTDRLRMEIAGSGRVISFQFDGAERVTSLELDGVTFTRTH
jgi:CubicO group peptidase (beta-lactamase class C family)